MKRERVGKLLLRALCWIALVVLQAAAIIAAVCASINGNGHIWLCELVLLPVPVLWAYWLGDK